MDGKQFNNKFKKKSDLSAIILAGGKSSRIGKDQNKAMLRLNGKKLLDIVISKLKVVTENIIIVGSPQNYSNYNHVVSDLFIQKTPLVGIYSGLKASSSWYNLVVGCDMPFLNVELINYMAQKINANHIVIPRHSNEYIEPLCSIYSKDCLQVMRKNILNGNFSIREILPYCKVEFIDEKEIKRFDPCLSSFFNINYLKDLSDADKLLKNNPEYR